MMVDQLEGTCRWEASPGTIATIEFPATGQHTSSPGL
jgi:hypothetical protein